MKIKKGLHLSKTTNVSISISMKISIRKNKIHKDHLYIVKNWQIVNVGKTIFKSPLKGGRHRWCLRSRNDRVVEDFEYLSTWNLNLIFDHWTSTSLTCPLWLQDPCRCRSKTSITSHWYPKSRLRPPVLITPQIRHSRRRCDRKGLMRHCKIRPNGEWNRKV